jgi:OOP family OmpA-OmpF porin
MQKKLFRSLPNLFIATLALLMVNGCATVCMNTNPTSLEHIFIVGDASSSMQLETKIDKEVIFLEHFIDGMPDGNYLASILSFNSTSTVLRELRTLNRGMAKRSANKLSHMAGETKLETALRHIQSELIGRSGKTAIVVLSDGLQFDTSTVYFAAKELIESYPGQICIHTVLFGNESNGYANLNKLSQMTDCGSHRSASLINDLELMGDFVDEVFYGIPPVDDTSDDDGKPEMKDSDGDGVPDAKDECANTPAGAKVDERGCWVIQNIIFELNKSDILPEFHSTLDEVVTVLKNNSTIKIRIDGHTCSRGTEAYNQALSLRRANAVRSYLTDHGIDAARLTSKGFGESKPILPNDSEANRSKNRRVELTVVQ